MKFEFNQKSCPWLVRKSLFSKPGQKDRDACLATKGPCQVASCAPYHWVLAMSKPVQANITKNGGSQMSKSGI